MLSAKGALGTYAHVCYEMGINILAETMKTVLLSAEQNSQTYKSLRPQ